MAESSRHVVMETINSVVNYDLSWKIHGFKKILDEIQSEEFTPSPTIPLKFVVLCERLKTDSYEGLSFKLVRRSPQCLSNTLRVQFKLSIVISDGAKLISSTDNWCYFVHEYNDISLLTIDSDDNKSSECRALFLSLDVVIVNCHFEFFGHDVTTKSKESLPMNRPSSSSCALSSDFKALYDSQLLCDFTIRVGGNILRAHQAVLVARSPVLKNMMKSSCLESKTKCLDITDVDIDVFEYFLKYLYTGEIEDKTFTAAWNLYPLADKYHVPSFRVACGDILASDLSVDTVFSVLLLSYLHSDEFLKSRAIHFISTKFCEFKSNPKWKEIIKTYPELASEVLDHVISDLKFPN